jgi:uncharacterized coiled-coil DUF342 family protein
MAAYGRVGRVTGMDNQRDKQGQYVPAENQYPRAELSADNNLFVRGKRLSQLLDKFKRRSLDEEEVGYLFEEIERLQQRLTDYEGCKGIEEYYAAISKCRELTAQVSQLREERDDFKHSDIMLQLEVKQLREERDALAKELEFKRWFAKELHGERTVAEAERDKLKQALAEIEDESSQEDADITRINGIAQDSLRALGIGE